MKGVNRAIHDLLEQRLVDQLLALDSRQAFEYVTHHDDQVMGTINLYLNQSIIPTRRARRATTWQSMWDPAHTKKQNKRVNE